MGSPVLIQAQELRNLYKQILHALKVEREAAFHVVEGLIETSLRGVDSHGIRLFPHYVRALKAGRINGRPDYKFTQTAAASGRLDADHTYGHAAGACAMQKAMEMAAKSGIAAVVVYNSSHFGAAAYYALMAARKDLIGLSFTHADSLMLTPGGKEPFFGTNPICFAAPVEGEDPFCLDMATTTYTWNKVKMYRESGEKLPPGIAADGEGDMTTDPHKAACLLPVGDFKGFGLGMVVDILCGLLSGMTFGQEISSMYKAPLHEKRFLGQFYAVIDIAKFTDLARFKKRLKANMDKLRKLPAKNPAKPVVVAGDPEKAAFIERSENGIPLSDYEYKDLEQLCREEEVELKNFRPNVVST